MSQINKKKAIVEQNIQIIIEKDKQIETVTKEKLTEIFNQEQKIKELRRKIEEMSSEFARMLKETLEKMQERIE